jgi:hypothetical protein
MMPNPLWFVGPIMDLNNLLSKKNVPESYISVTLLGLSSEQSSALLSILGEFAIDIALVSSIALGPVVSLGLNIGYCLLFKALPCYSNSSKKINTKAFEFYTKEDLLPILIESHLAMNTYAEIALENYGNLKTSLTATSSRWLKESFLPVISEFSEHGNYISSNEYQMLINSSSSNTWTSKENFMAFVDYLVERFNNTQIYLADSSQG